MDRIGSGRDTTDETQLDTAIDLTVYLAKYLSWLSGGNGDPDEVEQVLHDTVVPFTHNHLVTSIAEDFSVLERAKSTKKKVELTDALLDRAYALALSLWR